MKEIRQDLLTINDYSRTGKKLKEIKSIIVHWTGNVGLSAQGNRNFFEDRKNGKLDYGSAHYIIDKKEIIQCIPDDEVAYHCGTSKIDPASGKVYTDYARAKFGDYCLNYKINSPNNCTIGIEMCPADTDGNFDKEVWDSTVWLVKELLVKYNLTINDITTHNLVTGWKNCPKLFTDKPEEFEKFKNDVKVLLVLNGFKNTPGSNKTP